MDTETIGFVVAAYLLGILTRSAARWISETIGGLGAGQETPPLQQWSSGARSIEGCRQPMRGSLPKVSSERVVPIAGRRAR